MMKRQKMERNFIFKNIKWRPQNLYDSVLPISILNWITGLNILEYPMGKSRPMFTYIYTSLNVSLYWFIYFFNNSKLNFNFLNKVASHVFMSVMYMNSFISTFSILINWYYNKVRL